MSRQYQGSCASAVLTRISKQIPATAHTFAKRPAICLPGHTIEASRAYKKPAKRHPTRYSNRGTCAHAAQSQHQPTAFTSRSHPAAQCCNPSNLQQHQAHDMPDRQGNKTDCTDACGSSKSMQSHNRPIASKHSVCRPQWSSV
jgi:hypothetical protein